VNSLRTGGEPVQFGRRNSPQRHEGEESRTENTEYRIQNTEYRIQNTEYRSQDPGVRIGGEFNAESQRTQRGGEKEEEDGVLPRRLEGHEGGKLLEGIRKRRSSP
jgi:hypothetical protein